MHRKFFLFMRDYINGASYFRSTELARESFRAVSETAKYEEDTTSSMYALLQGYVIRYVGFPVVWYEYGEGVSTNQKEHWKKILDQDLIDTAMKLRQEKKDACLEYFLDRRGEKRVLGMVIRHPLLFLRHTYIRSRPRKKNTYMGPDSMLLQSLLEKTYEKEFELCKS